MLDGGRYMEVFRELSGAPKPVGPYSAAVRANGMLYLAGQIALDPNTGALVSGGIEAQTSQVLANLDAVLRGCGSERAKIVMTTIFLCDIADGKVVNELYAKFVSADAPPARQTVAVKALPLGALVEISVIAVA